MAVSKAWDWGQGAAPIWLTPSEESYCCAQKWKEQGVRSVLDFGCGLGRHAVYFVKQGFAVSAFDLSEEGVAHLKKWAEEENLSIDACVADMMRLPYPDNRFDAAYLYHVISHTDSAGIRAILSELTRVLRPGGRVFLTLCSKESRSYRDAGYPKLDENTVVKTGGGPEDGIPHFYVSLDEIFPLLADYEIERIRHTNDCYSGGTRLDSWHYFISAILTK